MLLQQGGAMCERWRFYLLILLAVLLVGCSTQPQSTGVLEGHVTIGPLVPVLREGEPEPTVAPEVFAARQIVIFKSGGRKEAARVEIDSNGNYRVELPVGSYTVDINHSGIDMAKGLPAEITIQADQVTRLDVDIDTGIR
jgi:hypothetical protein